MTDDKEIIVPRTLRGRRARRHWRELAPICAKRHALNACSELVLATICTKLADLERKFGGPSARDMRELREMSKPLGLVL